MDRKQLLYKAVSYIPKGKVASYARIGKMVGILNPRVVGTLLHKNPDPKNTPCHRVVTSKGDLAVAFAFGGASAQKQKLTAEGVVFRHNRVNIQQCLWKPPKSLKNYFQSLKLEKTHTLLKKPS